MDNGCTCTRMQITLMRAQRVWVNGYCLKMRQNKKKLDKKPAFCCFRHRKAGPSKKTRLQPPVQAIPSRLVQHLSKMIHAVPTSAMVNRSTAGQPAAVLDRRTLSFLFPLFFYCCSTIEKYN